MFSDSAYGKLRFGVPQHALRFYFPGLWLEAEQTGVGRFAWRVTKPVSIRAMNNAIADEVVRGNIKSKRVYDTHND